MPTHSTFGYMSPKNSRQPQFIASHRSHYLDKTHLCRIFAPPCSRERLSPGPLTVDSSSACLWGAATAPTPLTFTKKSQPTDLVSASTHVHSILLLSPSYCFFTLRLLSPATSSVSRPTLDAIDSIRGLCSCISCPKSRPKIPTLQPVAFDSFSCKTQFFSLLLALLPEF